MKITAPVLVLAAAFGLAGCGGGQQSPAENTAEALENAAEQSTPEAAAVLENQADQIRDSNVTQPISEPGSAGQQALQDAGNAQVGSAQAAPAAEGAKPHAAGDPVPPPQTSGAAPHGSH